MSNEEIARVFREMADLLRIEGGEKHRAKAFERTAEILEGLREPAAELFRFGRLAKVRGIGPGSMERIRDIVKTGTCADHRRLRAKMPVGLRELLELHGVGPAHVRQLWLALGVTDVASLEGALASGRVARLPGVGPRTVEVLRQSLAQRRRNVARLLLPDALALGERLARQIEAHPACLRVAQVGSARRREETVGDIDFVAAALDAAALVTAFTRLDDVGEVLLDAPTRGSVRLHDGRQSDIWVVPPENWGAALHAFSGTKAHVVEMRKRAGLMGVHLSEFGIYRSDRSLLSPGTREDDVFAAVGLPFIAPELRQANGEIEAAERGRLPVLVELADLRGDMRVHAGASLDEDRALLLAARAAGREHVVLLFDTAYAFESRASEVRALAAELGVGVVTGVLAAIDDEGGLPPLPDGVEWVTAALTTGLGSDGEQLTVRVERALASGLVDCLAHPLGRAIPLRPSLPLDLERVLQAALRNDVALELWSDPRRLDLDARACRLAKERGVAVAVATGARAPSELAWLRWGMYQARRGWLARHDVLNSLTADQLLARRRRGGRAAVASAPRAEPSALVKRLAAGDVDDELRARLERWMREGDDVELERALAAVAQNPMQRAFELSQRVSPSGDRRGDPL